MTEPIRISCSSAGDVPSASDLATMADGRRHVVLIFQRAAAVDKTEMVAALRAQLPDHSVFDSGGDAGSDWVSVVRVVGSQAVRDHAGLFAAAIDEYRRRCTELVSAHRSGQLGDGWTAHEHGEHCRFQHGTSGQVVEAPLERSGQACVDPYFFWEFVTSTPDHAAVAALIPGGFHDAARALDVLTELAPD